MEEERQVRVREIDRVWKRGLGEERGVEKEEEREGWRRREEGGGDQLAEHIFHIPHPLLSLLLLTL